jgi:Flp pilus assembly protein TadB
MRGAVGVVAGVVVGLITGWPVAALAALAGGLALPAISGGRRAQRAQIEKAEALPAWCEMLRDTLSGSAHGLETVIRVTAQVAPVSIRPDTQVLGSNLARLSLDDALLAFADRVDDPVCDQVVMGLRLRGSGDLTAVLSSIAASARQEVELRRRVEAGRAGQRWTARVIIAITVLLAGGITLFHGAYLGVYSTPAGQLMLLVVLGFFAAGLWLMERVTRGHRPPRLLVVDVERSPR